MKKINWTRVYTVWRQVDGTACTVDNLFSFFWNKVERVCKVEDTQANICWAKPQMAHDSWKIQKVDRAQRDDLRSDMNLTTTTGTEDP